MVGLLIGIARASFFLGTPQVAASPQFQLTRDEAQWLKDHPGITVVLDPDWPPIEFQDETGRQSGMSQDYLDLIEERIGYKFKRITGLKWSTTYERLKRWDYDMTVAVSPTKEREGFWLFTEPYLEIPIVIATQTDVTYIANLNELGAKPVAVSKGYSIEEWMSTDYPRINLVRVATPLEGLQMLQRGEVFAYLDNLLVIGYYQAKMQAHSIKISGQTPYSNKVSMAIRKDWPVLASIVNRALKSITKGERDAIYRRRLPVRYEHGFDYALLWRVVAGFAVLLAILGIWNGLLAKEVRRRKKVEAALVESEGNYRSLLAGIPNVVLRFDPQGRVVFASKSLAMVSGVPLDEVLGRPLRETPIPEQASGPLDESVREAARKSCSMEIEIEWLPGGEAAHVVRVIPELGAAGEVKSVLAVSHDISDRKRYEQKILALNEELEKEVENRTQQLQNALSELDSFSYSVSHDLRAPLRAIDGFSAELLEDYGDQLSQEAKDALERVRGAVRRMSELIDGLLSLSRLARAEIRKAPIDLSELLQSVAESEIALAGGPRTEIAIEPGMAVESDPVLLSSVVGNLLGNAIKYTRKEPYPRIECGRYKEDGTTVYYIRDNGVGFDMAYADKLFTAFQRMHSEKEFSGTGIGLATVRRILGRLGGKVWAESEVGKGATFYFTLGEA